jgi:type IV pilus assembly protein PilO
MALNTSDPKFQKAALIVLVVAAACYGYFAYVYGPKVEGMEKVEAELKKVEQSVNAARTVAQASDTLLLQQELAKRQRELAMVEELLPSKENLPELLERVARLGHQAGVYFALFEPQTPIQHEIYQERPYKLTLRGGFHQTARFLAEVAGMGQIVKPMGLSMVRDLRESAGPQESLTAELTLSTYLMIPAQTQASAAQGGQEK